MRNLRFMAVGEDPSFPFELDAFRKLVAASKKKKLSLNQQKFVKKLDNIPSVDLPAEHPCLTAMNIADWGIIGQFTGLWPSPKAIDRWVHRNWKPLISEGIGSHLVGKDTMYSCSKTQKIEI